MPIETHCSILGISRAASTDDIEAAYRAIFTGEPPRQDQAFGPLSTYFSRSPSSSRQDCLRSTYRPQKAKKYDDEMEIWGSFGNAQTWRRSWEPPVAPVDASEPVPPRRPAGQGTTSDAEEYKFADAKEEETRPYAGGSTSFSTSSAKGTSYGVLQAEYRYGLTRTVTDGDVKVKGWNLHLLLSTKFHLLNTVTALPTGSDTRTIAFQLHIQRNKTYPSTDAKVIELIVSVGYVPNGARAVGNIQTVLKEVTKDSLTLTLYMASVPSGKSPDTMPPWKFGFDFDMNGHPAAWGRKRGTCMIFTVDKQSVEETPEDVLKNEEGLVANAFCGLGDEKLMGVTYKTVRMWRMAAVGYGKNDFLEG
ncbi:hypothetical protein AG0111_0g3440 [Alternaria gaisen]|uniref:Uncharacterized protein n=1 Tax=Alternaria gaisen TaxID=167740 RepID=A0ACB6FV02_9PLEO|nr:hypothetical protein AG0111_0g3440 [Alternaria gaisen]